MLAESYHPVTAPGAPHRSTPSFSRAPQGCCSEAASLGAGARPHAVLASASQPWLRCAPALRCRWISHWQVRLQRLPVPSFVACSGNSCRLLRPRRIKLRTTERQVKGAWKTRSGVLGSGSGSDSTGAATLQYPRRSLIHGLEFCSALKI